jgi:hypothetical protein
MCLAYVTVSDLADWPSSFSRWKHKLKQMFTTVCHYELKFSTKRTSQHSDVSLLAFFSVEDEQILLIIFCDYKKGLRLRANELKYHDLHYVMMWLSCTIIHCISWVFEYYEMYSLQLCEKGNRMWTMINTVSFLFMTSTRWPLGFNIPVCVCAWWVCCT